jgi:hypothetical protein
MRGKKSDPEFVSQFISQCLQQGSTTTEEMVKRARQEIQNIDNKIIEVEKLKVIRSKMLDVILVLDKPELKVEEAKLLPFFKLQYPQKCKHICDMLREGSLSAISSSDHDPEYIFCIKQLIETKIANKMDYQVVRGERFDEYLKFVLREVE